ncbi:MAG TPA: DUF1385 domain-containing protein [Clostridiaceae bacterium]
MRKNCSVGGQAVIEGVMMRGSKGLAIAVRCEDGNIVVKKEDTLPISKRYKILSVPIIRGFASLIDSLVEGIKSLNYSASFFEEEEEETSFEKLFKRIFKDKSNDVTMGFSLIISLALSVGIFFIFPTFVANVFKGFISNNRSIILNIIEGVIRVMIFITYIYLVGKLKDIHRVFQYHGAEHKTVFCYENEQELTPENARKFKRFHPRCGTNFLFLVMIISIILFSFTGWNSLLERIISRVLLLPIISGITYELIRWMGKSDSTFAKILAYPGLALQKLTTQEPDDAQLEVAIAALEAAEGIEKSVVNLEG